MPILTRDDGSRYYVAPEPTAEQKANAEAKRFDAWDRLGSVAKGFPLWDFAADDTGAAPGLIHDEEYNYKLEIEERQRADRHFDRNFQICARAEDRCILQILELGKAKGCASIVYGITALGGFPTDMDRNTDVTRLQGLAMLQVAWRWVNVCADHIGDPLPYPNVSDPLALLPESCIEQLI